MIRASRLAKVSQPEGQSQLRRRAGDGEPFADLPRQTSALAGRRLSYAETLRRLQGGANARSVTAK